MVHRFIIFFIIILLFNSSCTPIVTHHGYYQALVNSWSKIKPGHSKDEVLKILGEPSITSVADSNTWYYVSYNVYRPHPLTKRQYDSQILEVTFNNKSNKVIKVKQTYTKKRNVIKINSESTKLKKINNNTLDTISIIDKIS